MKKEIRIGIATAGILCVWLFGGFYLIGSMHLADRLSYLRRLPVTWISSTFAGVLFGIRKARKKTKRSPIGRHKNGSDHILTVAVIISVADGLHFFLHPQICR